MNIYYKKKVQNYLKYDSLQSLHLKKKNNIIKLNVKYK